MRSFAPAVLCALFGSTLVAVTASTGCGGDDDRVEERGPASSSGSTSGETSSGSTSGGTSSGATSSGATSSGTADAEPPSPVNVTNETLMVNGAARKYLLAVPKTYDAAKKYPLVLVFHGQPGDGTGMHAYYPLEAASSDEAILAYPDGTDGQWNLFEDKATNQDMRFIRELVDELGKTWSIEPGRVFADGWSNGAFFLHQLACRFGLFKAVAAHAGGAPYDDPDGMTRCTPTGPMPTLITHYKGDGVVPFGGSVDTAYYWRTANGCADETSASTPAPCVTYACAPDKPVKLCALEGASHGIWPEAAKTAWAFFESIP